MADFKKSVSSHQQVVRSVSYPRSTQRIRAESNNPVPGEVTCPVCSGPATRSLAPDRIRYVYSHAYRLFPCISVTKVEATS